MPGMKKISLAEFSTMPFQSVFNRKNDDREKEVTAVGQKALSKAASSSRGSNETIPAVLGSQESLNRSDSPSQPTKDPRTLALDATMEDLKNQLDAIKAEDQKKQVTFKHSGTESKPFQVVHQNGKASILTYTRAWDSNSGKYLSKAILIDPTSRDAITELLRSATPVGVTITDLKSQLDKLIPGKDGQTVTLKHNGRASNPIVIEYDNEMKPLLLVPNFKTNDESIGLFRLETLVSPDDIESIRDLTENIDYI